MLFLAILLSSIMFYIPSPAEKSPAIPSGESNMTPFESKPFSLKVDLLYPFIHLEVERLVRLECDLLPSPEKNPCYSSCSKLKYIIHLQIVRTFPGAELIQNLYKTRRRYDAIPEKDAKKKSSPMDVL